MSQTHTFDFEKHITRVGFLPVSYVQQLSQVDNLNLASGKKGWGRTLDLRTSINPFSMIFMNKTYL